MIMAVSDLLFSFGRDMCNINSDFKHTEWSRAVAGRQMTPISSRGLVRQYAWIGSTGHPRFTVRVLRRFSPTLRGSLSRQLLPLIQPLISFWLTMDILPDMSNYGLLMCRECRHSQNTASANFSLLFYHCNKKYPPSQVCVPFVHCWVL